jgi:excisionase family DNA binding protein
MPHGVCVRGQISRASMQSKIENVGGLTISDILTVDEVATYLKLRPVTIMKLAKAGKLPYVKIRGMVKFSRKQLAAILKG